MEVAKHLPNAAAVIDLTVMAGAAVVGKYTNQKYSATVAGGFALLNLAQRYFLTNQEVISQKTWAKQFSKGYLYTQNAHFAMIGSLAIAYTAKQYFCK